MDTAPTYMHTRESVLNASKWLSENGFFGTRRGTGGNVSQRIEKQDLLAITPTSKCYGELSPEDICLVDFHENLLDGPFLPSIEITMHITAYQGRSDITALVHTHSSYASVFSVLNRSVPALFEEVLLKIGPQIEIISFAPSGSRALANNVLEKLQNNARGYIIQNHGALSLGSTMDEALLNAELIEKVCQVYYRALATGLTVFELPPDATGLFQL